MSLQSSDMADLFFSATRGNTMENELTKINPLSLWDSPDIAKARAEHIRRLELLNPVLQPKTQKSSKRKKIGKSLNKPSSNLASEDPFPEGFTRRNIKFYKFLLSQGWSPEEARIKVLVCRRKATERSNERHEQRRADFTINPEGDKHLLEKANVITTTTYEPSAISVSKVKTIEVVVLPKEYPEHTLCSDDIFPLEDAIVDDIFLVTNLKLKFGGIRFQSGMFIVNCDTQRTAEWLIQQVPKLSTWKGVELMTCTIENIPNFHVVSISFPKSVGQETKRLFSLIECQNEELTVQSWKILDSNNVGTDQRLTIRIDHQSFETINNNGNWIYYRFGKVPVSHLPQETPATSASESIINEQNPQTELLTSPIGNKPKSYIILIVFPNSLGEKAKRIFSLIESLNKDLTLESWKVLNSQSKGKDQRVTIRIDDQSFETIRNNGNLIYYKYGKIPVSHLPQATAATSASGSIINQQNPQTELMASQIGNKPKSYIILIVFPDSLQQRINRIFSLIEFLNKDLTLESWKVLSSQSKGKDQHVTIRIDDQSFETIRNNGDLIYYKFGKIPVLHVQATPASSVSESETAQQHPKTELTSRTIENEPNCYIVSIVFPKSVGQETKRLFSLIESQNKELTLDSWEVLDSKSEATDQNLTIRIDDQSFETIKNNGNFIYYRFGKISVSHLQDTPASSASESINDQQDPQIELMAYPTENHLTPTSSAS